MIYLVSIALSRIAIGERKQKQKIIEHKINSKKIINKI